MNLKNFSEDQRQEFNSELALILSDPKIQPFLNHPNFSIFLADFNISAICSALGWSYPDKVVIAPSLKKLETLKQKIVDARLEQISVIGQKGKSTFVNWEHYGGSTELSKFDLALLYYLESISERDFYLREKINSHSEMNVSVRNKEITGISVTPNWRDPQNSLFSFPKELLNWPLLESLNLSGNKIPMIPEEIQSFSNLRRIYLRSNEIKSIPSTFYSLKNLEVINLAVNQIGLIKSSIVNFKKLRKLDLSYNKISKLPEEFFSISSLKKLRLIRNDILELSPAIQNLHDLEEFSFGCMDLESLPEALCTLKNLKRLDLEIINSNQLPESIGELSSLEKLYLTVKNFSNFPGSFGNLKKLEVLWISSEKGKILPKELKELKSLDCVYLSGDIAENLVNGYTPDKQSKEVLDILQDRGVGLYVP